jgi:hypothetical protein
MRRKPNKDLGEEKFVKKTSDPNMLDVKGLKVIEIVGGDEVDDITREIVHTHFDNPEGAGLLVKCIYDVAYMTRDREATKKTAWFIDKYCRPEMLDFLQWRVVYALSAVSYKLDGSAVKRVIDFAVSHPVHRLLYPMLNITSLAKKGSSDIINTAIDLAVKFEGIEEKILDAVVEKAKAGKDTDSLKRFMELFNQKPVYKVKAKYHGHGLEYVMKKICQKASKTESRFAVSMRARKYSLFSFIYKLLLNRSGDMTYDDVMRYANQIQGGM